MIDSIIRRNLNPGQTLGGGFRLLAGFRRCRWGACALTLNLRCIGDNLSPDQQLHLTLALGEMKLRFHNRTGIAGMVMDGIDAVKYCLVLSNN